MPSRTPRLPGARNLEIECLFSIKEKNWENEEAAMKLGQNRLEAQLAENQVVIAELRSKLQELAVATGDDEEVFLQKMKACSPYGVE
jgi:hypothetical protein